MTGNKVDPITLEVLYASLPAIANDMATDIRRSSYNMMIYEVGDFVCAVLGPNGELIAQNAGGLAHFVTDLGVIIRDALDRFGAASFEPGDVVLHNHQRSGGQHLNNVCVYRPIFRADALIGFSAIRAHWVDIGGMSTGFGAQQSSVDPWLEGLQLDHIKIRQRGEVQETVFRMITDNIRMPESVIGDLRAQIAACEGAAERFVALYDRYGAETVESTIARIFELAEARCRRVVERLPDGVYEASSSLDLQPGTGEVPVVHVRVTISGSDMEIDFSGSSPQMRAPLNGRTLAGGLIAYKAITTPAEPVNEGSFNAVRIVIPEGNVMMAKFPAPMGGWSKLLPTAVETVMLALAPAMPERIPACHSATLGVALVFTGVDAEGRRFVSQSIEGGGWGGRPYEDGPSASVSVCQGDVRNAPVENLELKVPLLIEARELVPGSGGAGKYRGGMGLRLRGRNLVDGRWLLSAGIRRTAPPWGLNGGAEGSTTRSRVQMVGDDAFSEVSNSQLLLDAAAGTRIEIQSSGGGGWGSPLDRDPELVLADVIEGYVDIDEARDTYGVVTDGMRIDADATRRLRKTRPEPALTR